MKRVIPIPSVVNAAVPSTSVTIRPGSVEARTCDAVGDDAEREHDRRSSASTITTVEPIRAATYAQRGSGVPCMRLSTPSSRRIAVLIAMLTNVVAITP